MGYPQRLNQVYFGYKYKIFGVRHKVIELAHRAEMKGSIVTAIRARHQESEGKPQPDEQMQKAPVKISPEKVSPHLSRALHLILHLMIHNQVTTKFGALDRLKFTLLGSLFNLETLNKKGNKKKPNPPYEYVSIELDSSQLDFPMMPISFFLETMLSADCEMCVLKRWQGMYAENKRPSVILSFSKFRHILKIQPN